MQKLKLPYFKEKINLQNLQDEYETRFEFNDKEVDVFLNEMQIANKEQFDFIQNVLENLIEYDKRNRSFIEQDFENKGGLTYQYLLYHLKELKEDFEDMFDFNDSEINNLREFMGVLKITTISFYADCVFFDYCLDDEVSDQLLVIELNREKNLSILWES